jgi:hypothetical protein
MCQFRTFAPTDTLSAGGYSIPMLGHTPWAHQDFVYPATL